MRRFYKSISAGSLPSAVPALEYIRSRFWLCRVNKTTTAKTSGLSRIRFSFLFVIAATYGASATAATQTSLKDQTQIPYSWGDFVAGATVSGITVQGYNKTDGTAGGPIYVTNTHIFDNDPDPAEPAIEDIGIATFQYVLWKGSSGGAAGATNRLGAAFLGGFNLTDLDDETTNWSFLQIYTDAAHPAGIIDGGGFKGKVNGDIPGYNADPGWNFKGTAYDYFDVPFDIATTAETVSFETALVCCLGSDVRIRGDWKWSFTVDGMGGLTGMDVTSQANASNRLLNLYRTANPTITYSDIGVGTCHVPEPSTLAMLSLGFIGLSLRSRRADQSANQLTQMAPARCAPLFCQQVFV
jgi:hypothetical protein